MSYAKKNDLVILTNDLDFGAILAATNGDKPSVVQIRADDLTPETLANQVIAAMGQLRGDLERGALLTIEPGRARLRVLPLEQDG